MHLWYSDIKATDAVIHEHTAGGACTCNFSHASLFNARSHRRQGAVGQMISCGSGSLEVRHECQN